MPNKFYTGVTEATIEYFSFVSSGPSTAASVNDLNKAIDKLAREISADPTYRRSPVGAEGEVVLNSVKLMFDIVESVDVLIRPIAEIAAIDPLTGAAKPLSAQRVLASPLH